MFCPNCGTEIKSEVAFCPNCGATLKKKNTGFIGKATLFKKSAESFEGKAVPGKPKKVKTAKVYEKPSAKSRTLSAILCVALFLFGFVILTISSFRISLTKDNVCSVYRSEKLSEATVNTSSGRQSLVDVIMEKAIDVKSGKPIEQEASQVEAILDKTYVNAFAENVLTDYSEYFIFGNEPANLNSDAICGFIENVSFDLRHEIGYGFSNSEIKNIRGKIDDGSMSYLSINENGGGFKKHYKFNPAIIPAFFSIPSLIVFSVLAAACVILLFVVNKKSLPAAFGYNGKTFLALGSVNHFISLALLIIVTARKYYLLSGIIKYLAFGLGVCSFCAMATGICFLLIKSLFFKDAKTVEKQ